MKIIDLFSGIGGFSLAGHWMGWETICFCEKEPIPQRILAKNFPNVPIWDDIMTLTGDWIKQFYDEKDELIVTGGFPCQPASHSGKRLGEKDARWLWQEQLRIIQEVKPRFVVGENVTGILTLDDGKPFEKICLSLENEGYTVQPFIIPACAKKAEHQRDRVWILAHANGIGLEENLARPGEDFRVLPEPPNLLGGLAHIARTPTRTSSGNLRTGDGIPYWMDRIKGLGNTVVPQVVFEIYQAFERLNKLKWNKLS